RLLHNAKSDAEAQIQARSQAAGEGFAPGADFEQRLQANQAGGQPLPDEARQSMESRFRADFSGVRLHTGSESAQLNREISAQAFTYGKDIYLGEGKEDVSSSSGRQLLAHELTHTIQQGAAPQRAQRLMSVATMTAIAANADALSLVNNKLQEVLTAVSD